MPTERIGLLASTVACRPTVALVSVGGDRGPTRGRRSVLGWEGLDWVIGGRIKPGTPFVTRLAPGAADNLGGAAEVVLDPGGVSDLWFYMVER